MGAQETWTPLKVLAWTEKKFSQEGVSSPRLDAQVLLAHVLNCSRVELYVHFDKPLKANELATYKELIQKRLTGKPVAYLIGKKEFYSQEFVVDDKVLIPRPDTEILVDRAVEICKGESIKHALELCTGSGAVSVALAMNSEVPKIVASDVCEQALSVAAINIERFELGHRIESVLSDMWKNISSEPKFGLIMANPPYVRSADIEKCSIEVKSEPWKALDGGTDGLDFYRQIVEECKNYIKPGGRLLLEHGFDQREDIQKCLDLSGGTFVTCHKDLAGIERVSEIRF